MTEEQFTLARIAVACKGWRWMPGMADIWGERMREGDGIDRMHALPDLADPATLGCLLALVREAWKSPVAQVSPMLPLDPRRKQNWVCYINDDNDHRRFGYSEAEALVAALDPCGEHRDRRKGE